MGPRSTVSLSKRGGGSQFIIENVNKNKNTVDGVLLTGSTESEGDVEIEKMETLMGEMGTYNQQKSKKEINRPEPSGFYPFLSKVMNRAVERLRTLSLESHEIMSYMSTHRLLEESSPILAAVAYDTSYLTLSSLSTTLPASLRAALPVTLSDSISTPLPTLSTSLSTTLPPTLPLTLHPTLTTTNSTSQIHTAAYSLLQACISLPSNAQPDKIDLTGLILQAVIDLDLPLLSSSSSTSTLTSNHTSYSITQENDDDHYYLSKENDDSSSSSGRYDSNTSKMDIDDNQDNNDDKKDNNNNNNNSIGLRINPSVNSVLSASVYERTILSVLLQSDPVSGMLFLDRFTVHIVRAILGPEGNSFLFYGKRFGVCFLECLEMLSRQSENNERSEENYYCSSTVLNSKEKDKGKGKGKGKGRDKIKDENEEMEVDNEEVSIEGEKDVENSVRKKDEKRMKYKEKVKERNMTIKIDIKHCLKMLLRLLSAVIAVVLEDLKTSQTISPHALSHLIKCFLPIFDHNLFNNLSQLHSHGLSVDSTKYSKEHSSPQHSSSRHSSAKFYSTEHSSGEHSSIKKNSTPKNSLLSFLDSLNIDINGTLLNLLEINSTLPKTLKNTELNLKIQIQTIQILKSTNNTTNNTTNDITNNTQLKLILDALKSLPYLLSGIAYDSPIPIGTHTDDPNTVKKVFFQLFHYFLFSFYLLLPLFLYFIFTV